jgi:hypothetical protein
MRNEVRKGRKERKENLTGMVEGYEGLGWEGGPACGNERQTCNKYKKGHTFLSLELSPSRGSDNTAIIASSLFSLLVILLSVWQVQIED